MRYPRDSEFLPSQRELEAAKKAEQAKQAGGWGRAAGTIAGGALGALGFLGGPAVGTATLGAGAGIGGEVGQLIGDEVGNAEAEKQNEIVDAAELERQRKLRALQMRQQALDALENTG
jgi:hypothetical protein